MSKALERAFPARISRGNVIMFRYTRLLASRCAKTSQSHSAARIFAYLDSDAAAEESGRRAFSSALVADESTGIGIRRPSSLTRSFESADPYTTLSIGEIHSLLDAAAIDYRDCFERRELIARLQAAKPSLAPHVKSQLQYMLQRSGPPSTSAATPPSPLATNALFLDEQYVVNLFQAAKPAVVHVTIPSQAHNMFGMNPLQIPQGAGSGFLWDNAGHVVTNWHGAKNAKITLHNNQSFDAELRGAEPDKDLAVLKITKPSKFVPISIGSSSGLQVGQRVFAIGFPFALDQSLTAGIVSGLGREIQSVTGRTIRDVVQTDAAINPGNSGGPLLDSRGRLIGVNTMIYSSSGSNSGIGFCIPSDTVRRVVNQIIRHGRVIRPGLGIACLPDDVAASVLGSVKRGVVVRQVVPGSGAEQAGIRGLTQDGMGSTRIGDIIVSVGDQPVVRVEDLVSAVEQFSIGDQILLGVRRGNQIINIQVPLLKELQQ